MKNKLQAHIQNTLPEYEQPDWFSAENWKIAKIGKSWTGRKSVRLKSHQPFCRFIWNI